ncbi:hypothetical protein DH2020_027168 [Rehmannia glutinosa]|uniref:Uncharacterized protein n=1 Tax=Rehmannia glutinosa TaxID=99300 RepID=A0ABR0VUU8_REHGL
MASSRRTPIIPPTQAEKPKKFMGFDFKRWQQKMLFYLTTLSLAKYLTEDALVVAENETNAEKRGAVDAWGQGNFLCRNYVLNGLSDALYSVYCVVKSSKELWDSLEKKYKTEDAGTKKFVVGKFLDFVMVDSKTMMEQVQKFQLILHEISAEGMAFSEAFQVAALIEKFPPSWRDFKNYLKHKRKEMRLEDLVVKFRIEEDNRRIGSKSKLVPMESKANLMEHGSSSNSKKRPNDK